MSTGDMADGLDRNSIRILLEPVTIHPSTSEPDASSPHSIVSWIKTDEQGSD
ncbi:hypothetical protein PGT21_024678 [Puccinia graminis f. sp. tritici]|uniref:Uncharacterized protein n=1 Tax=Puccinia graminis f. sp. tritici TaxID=56615 RepID=A0A5B0QNW2_PUCGR|nr:hypothetical protein PGT21_024678 [Puccinia graminis f. sp. tritici]